MRISHHNLSFFLGIFCLGFLLAGTVVAEDVLDWTVGAYPAGPTSATGPAMQVGAYPFPISSEKSSSIQIGQTQTPTPGIGAVSTGTFTAVSTTQNPPVTQQKVLLNYNVQTAPPTAVYFSGTFMPWDSFNQLFPSKSPALWVASSAGWSWYATCPVGGWIQNLMYVPYTGTMKLYEFYPDGSIKLYSYGFNTPGYKYIWFYADTPGRHISLFTVFDKPSNYVVLDVT
jgi:hypothetical protein